MHPGQAQLRVVKQLVAGADKDLINTLSECTANILNGNMILQPHQKQRLSRHADALRAHRRQTVSQRSKKALLMDGGFAGLLASTVALLLFKAVPSIVSGVGSLVRRLKRHWHKLKSAAPGSMTFSTARRELVRGASSSSSSSCLHHHHCHRRHQHAERTTAAAAVCHPEMDPGKARHIAGLVVGRLERTLTSSSSARSAEREEKDPTTIATAEPGGRWRALTGGQRWGHAVVGLGGRPCGLEAQAGGAPGRQRGEDNFYRTSVVTSTWSSTWAATGGLAHARAAAPEAVSALKTQQRAAVSWNEDKGAEVPSSIRWCLIFTTAQEELRLARAWQESQAEAILPKTVRARALALLRWLTDGGYISWRLDTLELIVDGIEHKGTSLVDLAGHVMRERRTEPLVHGLPIRHGALQSSRLRSGMLMPAVNWWGTDAAGPRFTATTTATMTMARRRSTYAQSQSNQRLKTKKKKSYGKRKPLRARALIPRGWRRMIATGRKTTRCLPTVTSRIRTHLLTGSRTIRSSLHHAHYRRE